MKAWKLSGELINDQIFIGESTDKAFRFSNPEKEKPWRNGSVNLYTGEITEAHHSTLKEIPVPIFESKRTSWQSKFLEESSVEEVKNYIGRNEFSQILCETFREMIKND